MENVTFDVMEINHRNVSSPNLSNIVAGSSNLKTTPCNEEINKLNMLVTSFIEKTSTLTGSMNASPTKNDLSDNSPDVSPKKMKSFTQIIVNPSGIKQEPEEDIEELEETELSEEEESNSLPEINALEKEEETSESADEQPIGDAEVTLKPIILCGTCDKSLIDIPSFLEHCQEHGNENTPLKCALCGPKSKLLKSPYTLKKHQRYLHKMSKLKCPHCSKVFCPNYYNRHVKTAHMGVVKYDCNVCKKVLFTRKGYTAHMENHFPEKANHYNCPICNKSIRESYLSKHLRYHQLDESFMCEICGIVMHNRGNFVYHQETHKTGNSRHLCEICGKSYKTNRVLKKHYTIHTGASKVKCTICDSTLSNVHSLKTHMKTHQEERPFQCKFCGKGFKHPGHKTAHERIHTGERPYQCKICPSAFYEAGNLIKHMKKVHSNGKTSNKKFKFDSADTNNETAELIDPPKKEEYLVLQNYRVDNIL